MSLSIAFASQLVKPRHRLDDTEEDDDLLLLEEEEETDDVLLDTSAFANVVVAAATTDAVPSVVPVAESENKDQSQQEQFGSPVRVMDFPSEMSPMKAASGRTGILTTDDVAIIPRQLLPDLSLAPLEAETTTPDVEPISVDVTTTPTKRTPAPRPSTIPSPKSQLPPITPIATPKQRITKFQPLPHIPESAITTNVLDELWNTANAAANSRWSVTTELPKPKPNPATLCKKPSRLERSHDLAEQAKQQAATGNEPEAVLLYRRAYKVADAELTRLRNLLLGHSNTNNSNSSNKLQTAHPAARRSMQVRVQTDWRDTIRHMAYVQLERATLLERQGELRGALEACTQAKGLYKKLRKKVRQFHTAQAADATAKETASSNPTDDAPAAETTVPPLDTTTPSPPDGSTPTEKPSIPWLVPCPLVERDCKTTNQMIDRLTKSQSTYTERKQQLEDVLLLRQECLAIPHSHPRRRAQLFEFATQQAKQALAYEQQILGRSHVQTADLLHILSALALDQGSSGNTPEATTTERSSRDRAVQYLLHSYDLHRQALGDAHPRTGHDLLLLARATTQERSMTYYLQAAAVFRQAQQGERVVGSILNDVAVLHVARQEFAKALELLQEALEQFEIAGATAKGEDSVDSPESTSTSSNLLSNSNIDVVQVWRNMGECHMNLKQWRDAIDCFSTALEYQQSARKLHDADQQHDLSSDFDSSAADEQDGSKCQWELLLQMVSDESIADTLRRLGRAMAAAGQHKQALKTYEKSCATYRTSVNDAKVLAESGMATQLAAKQDQLAATLYNVGEAQDAMGSYEAAVQTFTDSMHLRTASDDQRSPEQRCNHVHCAMCLVGIANVRVKQQQYIEAHTLYNNALIFCEAQGIPFDNPLVRMIETRRKGAEQRVSEDPDRNAALTRLEKRAAVQVKKKQFDKAIRTLGEALAIHQATLEKLNKKKNRDAKDEAKSQKEAQAIVRLLTSCSKVFLAMGDKENAHRARQDALQLHRRVPPTKSAS